MKNENRHQHPVRAELPHVLQEDLPGVEVVGVAAEPPEEAREGGVVVLQERDVVLVPERLAGAGVEEVGEVGGRGAETGELEVQEDHFGGADGVGRVLGKNVGD